MRLSRLAFLVLPLVACSGGGTVGAPSSESVARDSGLVITHHVEGTGARPGPIDLVRIHYHGTFPDGSVFDSSVERGEPAAFRLGQVIACWTEGVQLMKVGGKATFICPPKIAYGEGGAGTRIPPNATLHFEVELLAVL